MTYLFTSPDNIPFPKLDSKIADLSNSETLQKLLEQVAGSVQTALTGRDNATPRIRGSVDGMNLDNLVGLAWFGWHNITSTGGATPLPANFNNRGSFYVSGNDQFNTVQFLTGREANTTWQRTCIDPNTTPKVWSAWRSNLGANGSANGRDLNAMFKPIDFGVWDVDATGGAIGLPSTFPSGKATLEIVGNTPYTVVQRLTWREQNITWQRTGKNTGAAIPEWSEWTISAAPAVSLRTNLGMIGDSLVASHNLVPSLTAALPGVYCYSRGWNGETTDGLALRLGANEIMWTVAGGVIPASGAVTVTTAQTLEVMTSDTYYTGRLAGIPGRINKTSAGFSFVRDDAGTAVTVSTKLKLDPTWTATTLLHMVGILAGRNDVTLGAEGIEGSIPAHVVANTRRIVESLLPLKKLFFLLGTINRTTEPRGSAGYEAVVEINRLLAELYPGQFIDLRGYLVHQAIYDLGITPTSADLANMANDCPPPSVMVDDTHYTDAAATAIVNNLIAPWLIGSGYYDQAA
ncbi:hypothetical protein [Glutamicibacter sp. FBE19]|uniref:hypothetical protein n=1 Tax=Glutamicibacter sp. FBE19 TaxID=2761534 RepID=UPI0018965696|nr:hypothetical protein [Glutamicibacter sp. FBE19]MBF6671606.1 hypothetical protein [Glutamicibacter sp. FBE19]